VRALHDGDDDAPWKQYTLSSTREAQRAASQVSGTAYEMHDK
jgi:hypothetical protein